MNVELAEKIIAKILMEPEQMDMDIWCSGYGDTVRDMRECGTTACIAGHAVILGARDDSRIWENCVQYPDGTQEGINVAATRLLGLDERVAGVLFYVPDDAEAVSALKYLIGDPSANAEDLSAFIYDGREDEE